MSNGMGVDFDVFGPKKATEDVQSAGVQTRCPGSCRTCEQNIHYGPAITYPSGGKRRVSVAINFLLGMTCSNFEKSGDFFSFLQF